MTTLIRPFEMGRLIPQAFSQRLTNVPDADEFYRVEQVQDRIFAGGRTESAGSNDNRFFLCRFNFLGRVVWALRIELKVDNPLGIITAMGATPQGDVFCLYMDDADHSGYEISKIDGDDGSIVWQKKIDTGADRITRNGYLVASDSAGNALVAMNPNTNEVGAKVVKLAAADGSEVWQSQMVDGSTLLSAAAIAVDDQDRPILVGEHASTGFMCRFTSAGAVDKAITLNNSFDDPVAVHVGQAGNIYAISDNGSSGAILKFDDTLALTWGRSYPIADIRGVTTTGNEDLVFAAGDDDTDGWFVSLDSSGTEQGQKDVVASFANTFRGIGHSQNNKLLLGGKVFGTAFLVKANVDLSNLIDGNNLTFADASLIQSTVTPTVTTISPTATDPNLTITTPTRTRTLLTPTENLIVA